MFIKGWVIVYSTPVLFMVFNRIETTKQVFDVIRCIKPSSFYIAADGPRKSKENEDKKCKEVREFIITHIDWPCEVKTLFREENLGCGHAISSAITWFFTNVEKGIILEDDCVPSLSFFSYCETLLEKYKNNENIFHISGHNPFTISKDVKESYYFSPYQHCWGWATWKRAWDHYSYGINHTEELFDNRKTRKRVGGKIACDYWARIFTRMEKHEIDTWDYQWTYAILKNQGICINPKNNLVKNIGFQADATHTFNETSAFANQSTFQLNAMIYPKDIKVKKRRTKKLIAVAFNISYRNVINEYIAHFLRAIHRRIRR